MAKKRKKEKVEEEEYEFRPPEFKEEEFLKKELKDIRTGIITVIFAISVGVVAGIITRLNGDLVIVAFFVGIAGVAVLKQFYAIVGVDTSEFKKKNWLGNSASFFFTFLAIWVLLMNVPFTDRASPDIQNVVVWVNDGTKVMGLEYTYIETTGMDGWVSMDPTNYSVNSAIHANAGYTVNITARVSDNGKLSTVSISQISQAFTPTPMTDEGENRFGYSIRGDQLGTSLNFYISATDSEGNSATFHPETSIPVVSP
jgi:hypothetical protein